MTPAAPADSTLMGVGSWRRVLAMQAAIGFSSGRLSAFRGVIDHNIPGTCFPTTGAFLRKPPLFEPHACRRGHRAARHCDPPIERTTQSAASVTTASILASCGAAGTRSTHCNSNAPAMRRASSAQQRQQPVIVAAAVSDAAARAIEGHAGNEHPVDARHVERRAMRSTAPGFRDSRERCPPRAG